MAAIIYQMLSENSQRGILSWLCISHLNLAS